jgi:hypothetical protein
MVVVAGATGVHREEISRTIKIAPEKGIVAVPLQSQQPQ